MPVMPNGPRSTTEILPELWLPIRFQPNGEAYLKDEKEVFPGDPRIGRECWVVSEVLTR